MNNNKYNLVFKNQEAKEISKVPLSFDTPLDLEIPKDTIWIEIKINRLIENKQYEIYTIRNIILKDILDNLFKKNKDEYYINTSRFKYYPGFSDNNLIIFNKKDELEEYIKSLILLFHSHPYGENNQESKIETTKQNNEFSIKLTKYLKLKKK